MSYLLLNFVRMFIIIVLFSKKVLSFINISINFQSKFERCTGSWGILGLCAFRGCASCWMCHITIVTLGFCPNDNKLLRVIFFRKQTVPTALCDISYVVKIEVSSSLDAYEEFLLTDQRNIVDLCFF